MNKTNSLFKLTACITFALSIILFIILPIINGDSAVAHTGVCYRCAMIGGWAGCMLEYEGNKQCKIERIEGGWRCATYGGNCNVGGGGDGDEDEFPRP